MSGVSFPVAWAAWAVASSRRAVSAGVWGITASLAISAPRRTISVRVLTIVSMGGVSAKLWLLNTVFTPLSRACCWMAAMTAGAVLASTSSRSARPLWQIAVPSSPYAASVRSARPPSFLVRMVASRGTPCPMAARAAYSTFCTLGASNIERASKRSSTTSPAAPAAAALERSLAITGTRILKLVGAVSRGGSSVTPRTVMAGMGFPPSMFHGQRAMPLQKYTSIVAQGGGWHKKKPPRTARGFGSRRGRTLFPAWVSIIIKTLSESSVLITMRNKRNDQHYTCSTKIRCYCFTSA